MALLLGDSWGKTQGCSEQGGAEEKSLGALARIWEGMGFLHLRGDGIFMNNFSEGVTYYLSQEEK